MLPSQNLGLELTESFVCSFTGAVGCAETIHQHLELKHIQLDSLGHLISRHMFTCGHFKKTAVMCANSLKFFTSNYKEVARKGSAFLKT